MRIPVLRTIALIALTNPAIAADLEPARQAWAPVASAWSWTGCYVGSQIGGLRGSSEKWIVRTRGGDFFGQSLGGHDVDGWIGGVRAGCDYQLDRIVLGVQAAYGWSEAEGSHASAKEVGVTYHSEVDGLASITGRLGYARNRLLGYLKGGVAWERDSYAASTTRVGTAYRATDTRPGWTVGVGGEYALTRSLSVFVEYNYYDLGISKIRLTPQLDGLRPAFVDIDESANVVWVGLNLRFGG